MTEVNTSDLGFETQIYADLDVIGDRLKFPDKTNRGKSFALLLMWKKIEQFAAKKYETLLVKLIAEEQLTDPKSLKTPGNFVLGESGKMSVQVNVSAPRREFNVDWLARQLNKDYNIPIAITKTLVENAKRPGETNVRRITILERGL
jgi:hypothetical protein